MYVQINNMGNIKLDETNTHIEFLEVNVGYTCDLLCILEKHVSK